MSVHRIVVLAGLALVVAGIGAGEGTARGGQPITWCGQVLTSDAYLAFDLYCPDATGIVVGAPGITIDLKGHTLRGNRSYYNGVDDDTGGFDGVAVKNGTVRGFYEGVIAYGDNVSVSDVLATGNSDGIYLGGDRVKVTSSTAAGNRIYGIAINGDSGSVKSSTAVGNDVGIEIDGDFDVVQSSTAAGNRYGFAVYGASAKIRTSTATGNGEDGIYVQGSRAQIDGNRTVGNGFRTPDLHGTGINASPSPDPPTGSNSSRGNDDPAGCSPASLC